MDSWAKTLTTLAMTLRMGPVITTICLVGAALLDEILSNLGRALRRLSNLERSAETEFAYRGVNNYAQAAANFGVANASLPPRPKPDIGGDFTKRGRTPGRQPELIVRTTNCKPGVSLRAFP
jgi:hypothetical protein